MSYYRTQLESWLKRIDVHSKKVLDIGGGENPIKTRVASWEVEDYQILDNDSRFNPNIFLDMNSELPPDQYIEPSNVIFCLEVAEYIYDPVQFHKNIFNLLSKDGVAYISYPTIYPLHNPPKIDYLRYTKNAIEKYLTLAGFKTWEITPRIVTEGASSIRNFWVVEGMHPMKNTDEVYDIGYMIKAIK